MGSHPGLKQDSFEGWGKHLRQKEAHVGQEAKVAIVTGAGQGFGAAIAKTLAGQGYSVIIAEYNKQTGPLVAKGILEQGGKASFHQTDVSSDDSVRAMVQFSLNEYGRIDGLVNNAGLYPKSTVVNMDRQEWDRVIAVNLKGPYLCCRYVLPTMISQRSGKIINLVSGHAFRGGASFSHYSASKAGLIALTKSVALEVAQMGVLVNAVAPGTSDTPMPRYHSTEEELQAKSAKIPMGRLGRTEDITEVVSFLLSDHNTFITGQTICANGGVYMLG